MDMAFSKNVYANSDLSNTMQVVFDKLDRALDDVENGRVLSDEEFWDWYDKEEFV